MNLSRLGPVSGWRRISLDVLPVHDGYIRCMKQNLKRRDSGMKLAAMNCCIVEIELSLEIGDR